MTPTAQEILSKKRDERKANKRAMERVQLAVSEDKDSPVPKPPLKGEEDEPQTLLAVYYKIKSDGTTEQSAFHVGMPHADEIETSNCPICRRLYRDMEKFVGAYKTRVISMHSRNVILEQRD